MESLLNRYRNITVLLLVIFAQLLLLAVQVKSDQDVRFFRVWTVTAVTPVARVVEWFRGGSIGFIRNYIRLKENGDENRRLHAEVGRLKLENNFLKNELATADRAKALQLFQSHTQSKTLAANVIGVGAGSNSNVVFINRGSVEGVMRGMAVVTPDGIVGKVIAAYPTASEVLKVTDPDFAAGVISQKSQVRGTLKGTGRPLCKVDYIPFEDKVEVGDWFFTSGDDRIFPRGFAAGVVKAVRPGQPFQEILIEPTGLQHGAEDVLILLQGVHEALPDTPPGNQPVYIAPPSPTGSSGAEPAAPKGGPGTEADKLRNAYKGIGEAQNHNFGEGPPGSKPPDFTKLGIPAGARGSTGSQVPPAGGQGPGGGGRPPSGVTGATGVSGATGAVAPAVPKQGDTVRRSNQAAGGPGGSPRQ